VNDVIFIELYMLEKNSYITYK